MSFPKFSSFFTGVGGGRKALGIAPYSQCPSCEKKSALHMTELFITPKVMYLPTVKLRRVLVATCPACHQSFRVKPEKTKELLQDISSVVFPKDLEELEETPLLSINLR